MHRPIVYPSQVPLADDVLRTNLYAMTALGVALQAILGTSTIFDGLACTPTSPASMQVKIAPGSVYALENVDGTAYSDLGSDTAHSIIKQGYVLDNTLLTCTAPATTGNSINYLVQAAYQDQDTDSVVLPYFDASNPAVAWAGPANAGTSQNTTRKGALVISLKAGTSATTGTQTTPSPDAGFTGLWVVTVANGAVSITSGNIALYPGAPFINYKLPQLSPGTVGRTRLTGNTTFHVSTSGSDLSGDGSTGSPWQTLQHAYSYIASNVDIAGFSCTVSVTDGSYTAGVQALTPTVGGYINFVGNTTTPTNCNVTSTSGDCFDAAGSGVQYTIAGFNMSTTGSGRNCITTGQNAAIFLVGKCNFGATASAGFHISIAGGGQLVIASNYTINGGAVAHYNVEQGEIFIDSLTVTVNSSPTFSSAFAQTASLGSIKAQNNTFTDTGTTTGVRYLVGPNGVIDTGGGGANYFPGSTSGSAGSNGGQYL